jgi:hypothetical protein
MAGTRIAFENVPMVLAMGTLISQRRFSLSLGK